MSALNGRRAMDARWPWHQRSVATGWMNATVEIFRRPEPASNYGYDPVTGGLTDGSGGYPQPVLIYRGQARGATNKDWRARMRTQRGDSGTLHSLRFQVPLADSPPVYAHDVLQVVDSPPDQDLTSYIFHVRNPLMSSNAWLRNLLCDVDAAHPQSLPEPYTAPLVRAEALPEPLSECRSCG